MLDGIKNWFLRVFGKSLVPLLQKALTVIDMAIDALEYVLTDVIDKKLQIPNGTVIAETAEAAMEAVKSVRNAIVTALEFLGAPVSEGQVVVSSFDRANRLKRAAKDLENFSKKLKS
jgi:flagellar hook-basal body complex protein FliE